MSNKRIRERVNGNVDVLNPEELSRAIITLSERINFLSAMLAKHPDDTARTTVPTVNDDETKGHVVGSIWTNETSNEVFVCVDNSSGAAVWTSITATGSGEVNTVQKIGTTTHTTASLSPANFEDLDIGDFTGSNGYGVVDITAKGNSSAGDWGAALAYNISGTVYHRILYGFNGSGTLGVPSPSSGNATVRLYNLGSSPQTITAIISKVYLV